MAISRLKTVDNPRLLPSAINPHVFKSATTNVSQFGDFPQLRFNRQEHSINLIIPPTSPTFSVTPPSSPPQTPLQCRLANMLGVTPKTFSFGPDKNSENEVVMPTPKKEQPTHINSAELVSKATCLGGSIVLNAPGLRNDFYSNLVSWSPKTENINVGLDTDVYALGTDMTLKLIPSARKEPVLCVEASGGGYMLVSTGKGNVFLVNQHLHRVKGCLVNDKGRVHVIKWFSNKKLFVLGDEQGYVGYYELIKKDITKVGGDCTFTKKFVMRGHKHPICGIAINEEKKEIAIGGNDNRCTIWDISSLQKPKFKFVLKHTAAVKAMSYCPWSKSLLATGGGMGDRNIRFWHTGTGQLLACHYTNFQVTSVSWSDVKKEVVVTYGFSETSKSLLIGVYSYPTMELTRYVPAGQFLRVLSASQSPDKTSICIAANDSTVRVYDIWKQGVLLSRAPETNGRGLYGSPLIELNEGIIEKWTPLR